MVDNVELRNARLRAHLSQKELAKMLGVAQTAVSAWESGVCNPRASTLFGLCKILRLDIKKVFIAEDKGHYEHSEEYRKGAN